MLKVVLALFALAVRFAPAQETSLTCNFTDVDSLSLVETDFENACGESECYSFMTETHWKAEMTADVSVEEDNNVTVTLSVATTGLTDDYATTTRVDLECFELLAVDSNTCTSSFDSASGCGESFSAQFQVSPGHAASLCPSGVVYTNSTLTMQLHAVVTTGYYDETGTFQHMVRARFCIYIDINLDFDEVLNINVEEVTFEEVTDTLDLSVGVEAVTAQADEDTPCDLTDALLGNNTFSMNERVSIHVSAEGDDAADYYAYVQSAQLRLAESVDYYALFQGRSYPDSTSTVRTGTYMKTAPNPVYHTYDYTYDDYFTFWFPAKLLDGLEDGQAELSVTVAFVQREEEAVRVPERPRQLLEYPLLIRRMTDEARKLYKYPSAAKPIFKTITRRLDDSLVQSNAMPVSVRQPFATVSGTDACRLTIPSKDVAILNLFRPVLASMLGFDASDVAVQGSNEVVVADIDHEVALTCKNTFQDEVKNGMINFRVSAFGTDPAVVQTVLSLFANNATFNIRTEQNIVVVQSTTESKKKSSNGFPTLYVAIGAAVVAAVLAALVFVVYRMRTNNSEVAQSGAGFAALSKGEKWQNSVVQLEGVHSKEEGVTLTPVA